MQPLKTRTIVVLMICSLAVVACAPILGSRKLNMSERPVSCDSSMGSYALPKVVMTATVKDDRNEQYLEIETTTSADRHHTYCLDYLASSVAADDVTVSTSKQGFLESVVSKSIEQSAVIIRTLIRTAFIAISRNSNGAFRDDKATDTAAEMRTVLSYTFDPFDRSETDFVNTLLAPFGFCVFVSDFTFDPYTLKEQDYCKNPTGPQSEAAGSLATYVQTNSSVQQQPIEAIYYRPPMTYRMEVWLKPDPNGPDAWQLGQDRSFTAPNLSPVLAVGVSRSLFAKRDTELEFDVTTGGLKKFCLHKSSEALEAIKIPVDIAYGLAALPSQTLIAQINEANGTSDLLVAQQKVVEAQLQLIQLQRIGVAANVSGRDRPAAFAGDGKYQRVKTEFAEPRFSADSLGCSQK